MCHIMALRWIDVFKVSPCVTYNKVNTSRLGSNAESLQALARRSQALPGMYFGAALKKALNGAIASPSGCSTRMTVLDLRR